MPALVRECLAQSFVAFFLHALAGSQAVDGDLEPLPCKPKRRSWAKETPIFGTEPQVRIA